MEYGVVGLSHRTAEVAIREKLALGGDRLTRALSRLKTSPDIPEAVVLSTCNRVEFYTVATAPAGAVQSIWSIVEEVCALDRGSYDRFRPHLYDLRGDDALRHLFRVAASLDSMVVGEPQILGQLKEAYRTAGEASTVGRYLGRGMERAFSAAKRVRTETEIGSSNVSVASVAAQLAGRIFGSLRGKQVLLVGAGEMAEQAARHIASHGALAPTIANRSIERAKKLADSLGGTARQLEALPELLLTADIVITSTGATEPILNRASLAGIMRARKYRSLFLIDIAVPRDVDPAAGELDNVYLYDVDDLEQVVASNLRVRGQEAELAESIVRDELANFSKWLQSADVAPTIVELRGTVIGLKDAELEKALAKLGHLDERDRKVVQALAHGLVNKVLHAPTMALKNRARSGQANRELLSHARELFGLPPEEE
jgi:glutamyl-tRNA reductase